MAKRLTIEVLSSSMEAVDKGDKLDEYQTIGERQEYALIDSRKPYVRIYRRNGEKLETGLPANGGRNFARTSNSSRCAPR